MNLQRIFDAVKKEPDQATIITAVGELEKQGYKVIINNQYHGSRGLILADETNELKYLLSINGVKVQIIKNGKSQEFRIHFLDIDTIAFTELKSFPIEYNPCYTINLMKN